MKDFYDILYLAEHEEFDAQTLAAAITKTFSHRGTDLTQAEFIFSEEFKTNRTLNEMWSAFLKRSGLDTVTLLPAAIMVLQDFLSIIFQPDNHGKWLPDERAWSRPVLYSLKMEKK